MSDLRNGTTGLNAHLDRRLVYHLILFFALALACWKTPQIRALDLRLNDLALSSQNAPARAPILIGEIDAESVAMAGGTPLSRAFYARLIDTAREGNVTRLWLNTGLAGSTGQEADTRLADAMVAFGPSRIGIPALNPTSLSEGRGPIELFLPLAIPLGTEFHPDADGWHRSVDAAQLPNPLYANPARWLAGSLDFGKVNIDQRIDPTSFERVSVARILDGSYTALAGKTLILGFSPRIAGTTLNLPSIGRVDHMTFMALGVETLLHGQEPTTMPMVAVIAAVALIGLLALLGVLAVRTRLQSGLLYLTGGYLIIACSVFFLHQHLVLSKIAFFLSVWSGALLVFTAYRYRIFDVIREVSAGDLSTEEAWAWRIMSNHREPVALVSLNGLKRLNSAAAATGLFDKDEPFAKHNIAHLRAALAGGDARQLLTRDGVDVPFNVRQPFAGLPLVQLEDLRDVEAERDRLTRALHTDPMTGHLNRAGFEAAVTGLPAPYGVILMDMNGFKAVNDTYGHQAGDELLKYAADRFAAVLRGGDHLARLGGDEFAVLLPGLGERGLVELTARALETSLDGPIELSSATVRAGVAAGVALNTGTEPFAATLDAADRAMYTRKQELKARFPHLERANDALPRAS